MDADVADRTAGMVPRRMTVAIGTLEPLLQRALAGHPGGRRQRCHVLFAGQSPLLVPATDLRFSRAALAFFHGDPAEVRRARGRLYLRAGLRFPPALHDLSFEGFLTPAHLGLNDFDEAGAGTAVTRIAVQCGDLDRPAVATLLLHASSGRKALARLALGEGANATLASEGTWLRQLAAWPALLPHLPTLRGEGLLPRGLRYLVMAADPLPDRPAEPGARLATAAKSFLQLLGRTAPVESLWPASRLRQTVRQRLQRIEPRVGPGLLLQLGGWLAEVDRLIGDRGLPFPLVHGDFLPHRLRLDEEGPLTVLDWSEAGTDGNPVGDYLHFHLYPLTAGRDDIGPDVMADLLGRAVLFLAETHPGLRASPRLVAALVMHYLLDRVTACMAADGGMDSRRPVIRKYMKCLTGRHAWFPAARPGTAAQAA